jgi:hypothetical protein
VEATTVHGTVTAVGVQGRVRIIIIITGTVVRRTPTITTQTEVDGIPGIWGRLMRVRMAGTTPQVW